MVETENLEIAGCPSAKRGQVSKDEEEVALENPEERKTKTKLPEVCSSGLQRQCLDLVPLMDQMRRLFPPRDTRRQNIDADELFSPNTATRTNALPRFSGEGSVVSWLDLVERRARHYGWSATDTLLAARSALTGSAKLWAETPCSSATCTETRCSSATWAVFRRELELRFGDAVCPAGLESLSHRRMRPDESAHAYVAEMESIAARANISPADARKYIIRGFTGDIETALLLSFARTRKEFIEILERYSGKNDENNGEDVVRNDRSLEFRRDQEHNRDSNKQT